MQTFGLGLEGIIKFCWDLDGTWKVHSSRKEEQEELVRLREISV